jgi:hypothetical protein
MAEILEKAGGKFDGVSGFDGFRRILAFRLYRIPISNNT